MFVNALSAKSGCQLAVRSYGALELQHTDDAQLTVAVIVNGSTSLLLITQSKQLAPAYQSQVHATPAHVAQLESRGDDWPEPMPPHPHTAQGSIQEVGLAVEVGTGEVISPQMRVVEVGAFEMRVAQVGDPQLGLVEVRCLQMRPKEVSARQVCSCKVSPVHVRIRQVGSI